jgi:hypothetical protein
MGKNNSVRVIIGIIFLFFILGFGTVYAAPDAYQQFTDWAQSKTNKAKIQIKSNLRDMVDNQIAFLTNKTKNEIKESNGNLLEFSSGEILDTTHSITKRLNEHKKELESTSQILNQETDNDFNNIINRINTNTNYIMKSIETDYQTDLGQIAYANLNDNSTSDENMKSKQKLNEEIELTNSTINQLKEQKDAEQNQNIKEYIQKKIDFLNQLVSILAAEK